MRNRLSCSYLSQVPPSVLLFALLLLLLLPPVVPSLFDMSSRVDRRLSTWASSSRLSSCWASPKPGSAGSVQGRTVGMGAGWGAGWGAGGEKERGKIKRQEQKQSRRDRGKCFVGKGEEERCGKESPRAKNKE